MLKTQLLLKNIITESDWNDFKNYIAYDFIEDNYFSELKEAEMMRERFEMLATVDEYAGKYISNEWIRKSILKMNDDDIKDMQDQIKKEKDSGEIEDEDDLEI